MKQAHVNAPADLGSSRELLLQPIPIETMGPERTLLSVQGRVIAFFPLGRGTVHAVARLNFGSGDHRSMRILAMRTPAKRTAHTFAAALRVMVAPPVATSAQDRTRMGAGSGDAAIDTGDADEFAQELLGRSPCDRIVDVNPCDA
jgi:hypothetical protein